MSPEASNESLHLRMTHLESTQSAVVADIKDIRVDVQKILLALTDHTAKACPKPGHCVIIEAEARTIRKDLDKAFESINTMQESVVSLQKWQTGLMYVYTAAIAVVSAWVAGK